MSERIKALLERRDWLQCQINDLSDLIDAELTSQVNVNKRMGGCTRVVLIPHVLKEALVRTRGTYQLELDHVDAMLKQMEALL